MSTLPAVPPLPANPTWDQQMRHAEALQRNAHISATIRLAEAQEAARLVMIRQAEAAERMLAELQAQPPAPGPAPSPDPAPVYPWQLRFQAMVDLVSTMTSTERRNPVAAAEAAAAQLAAINAKL